MVGLALFLTKADGSGGVKTEMERAAKKAVISLLGNTKGHNKTSPLFN